MPKSRSQLPTSSKAPGSPPQLSRIAEVHRREIIQVYLLLRVLFLVVSFAIISFALDQLGYSFSAGDIRRLWLAWFLFAGWSIPLALASFHLRGNRLALTDRLIAFSLLPDSIALFLAAGVIGGTTGLVYRSIYFLIAIHSYHFSPNPWARQPWTPRGGSIPLVFGAVVTVFFGMSVFCRLAGTYTPLIHYALECGLQAITATAFLLVRLSDLRRAKRLAESEEDLRSTQEELDRERQTEGRLLEAMQDVSSISRISDEAQLDEKLRKLAREIGQNLGSEYCALGLVRGEQLDVVARHASFSIPQKAKHALKDLVSRPLGKGLVGSIVAQNRLFRWNSDDDRDLVDLSPSELASLRISLDVEGTRNFRDEVLPSRAIRHVLVAPFRSQGDEEHPLGYIALFNKIADGVLTGAGFSDRDEERLGTIASQLAVAISNFERHRGDLARAENEAFFNSLTLISDLDDLFDRVLDYLNREYRSRVASLWLATEDGFGSREETLRVVLRSVVVNEDPQAPVSKKALEDGLRRLNISKLDECFIGRFFRDTEEALGVTYIDDMSSVIDSWAPLFREIGTPHLIAIPIRRFHERPSAAIGDSSTSSASRDLPLVGVVCLRPLDRFLLTSERRDDFERFASHLAVLIDQVRFRRRYGQIETLKNHLPELQSADLAEFYASVVGLVRDALVAEACSLFTVDPEGALILKATTADKAIRSPRDGLREELATADYIGKVVYPAGELSITARIAQVQRTTLIFDVHRNPDMSQLFMEVTPTPDHQSLIGAPIVHTDGTLLGVLRCINRKKAGALLPVFVQGDKEFLDLIVGIMARFIENAEASASKRDFLRQLAHELATPLAALRNQIDFLEDVTRRGRHVRDSEEQFSYLREQADFLQYLVKDIQYQFGRGAAIRPRYEFSGAVDLKPTIERIKKLLLPTARMDRQVDIITGTARMLPLHVDQRRMEQVIFNLAENAVKYSRRGGKDIFIGYDLFEDRDSAGRVIKWHRILFKDWGVGVKESDLPFIFEEYRRGTNIEGAPSGTGLGLAVAKRIVEAHGGRLSVQHLKNPTEFAVDLPDELTMRPPIDANTSD